VISLNHPAASVSKLHGVIPPLITPLKADGSFDFGGFERLIEFDIQSGVHGVFVMGTPGKAMCFTKAI